MNNNNKPGSLFKRNFNVSEEFGVVKRSMLPNSITYTESELAEEKRRARQRSISGTVDSGEVTPPPPEDVVLDTITFFSDNGNIIALYQKRKNNKSLTLCSFNNLNYTISVLKVIDITNSAFSGKTTEKCIVSNDGKFFVLSVPSLSSVYFYDGQTGSLLQTITDSQTNFGSMIAADSDLKGLVISTSDLNKEPNQYDVRSTSNSVSSVICYYRRNFNSENSQKFIKIHSRNAYCPIIDNSSFVFPYGFFYGLDYDLETIEDNVYCFQGVHRTSDIISKGNNFSLCCLGLKQDQLNFKSRFFNYDSPRYSSLRSSLTVPSEENYYLQFSKTYQPGQGFLQYIRNDSFYNDSTYKLVNNISCNIFAINKQINNDYLIDSSVYSSKPITENMFIFDLLVYDEEPIYEDNFNRKYTHYFSARLSSFNSANKELTPFENFLSIRQEEILQNKLCMNNTHVYNICLFDTNNIKNIRIHRFPIMSTDNLNIFSYIDYYYYDGVNTSITPQDPSIGLVKVMFSPSDRQQLENCFLSYEDSQQYFLGRDIIYDKPFLSNPSQCVDCEFDYEIQNNLFLTENITSCFCSDEYIFINFDTKTMILKINSDNCKSVKYHSEIDSLKLYNFFYNENGEYFSNSNRIYQFDRQNSKLIERVSL